MLVLKPFASDVRTATTGIPKIAGFGVFTASIIVCINKLLLQPQIITCAVFLDLQIIYVVEPCLDLKKTAEARPMVPQG